MDVKSASRKVLRLGKIQRRPELDALRGLFLVWMTLDPPAYAAQRTGQSTLWICFLRRGFCFSVCHAGGHSVYPPGTEDSDGVRTKLWMRALRIYGYHLIMLAMVFTVVAAFAAHTHRAAIYNLLNFYLAHPATAIIGSLLLIYCPPLLDILPMYVTFLLLTPYILNVAVRRGWNAHSDGQWRRLAAGTVRLAHLDAYPGGACDRVTHPAAGDGSLQPFCLAGHLGPGPVAGSQVDAGSRIRWASCPPTSFP